MEVSATHIQVTPRGTINLYPLGDIHAGSVQCAEDVIKRQVEVIKQDKTAWWIGMGDYADCILKGDKRWDSYGIAQ